MLKFMQSGVHLRQTFSILTLMVLISVNGLLACRGLTKDSESRFICGFVCIYPWSINFYFGWALKPCSWLEIGQNQVFVPAINLYGSRFPYCSIYLFFGYANLSILIVTLVLFLSPGISLSS